MRFHAYRTRREGRELTAVLRLEEPLPSHRWSLFLVATGEGIRIIDAASTGSVRITDRGTVLQPADLHEFCIALRAAGELSLRLRQGQELDELPWG